MLHHHMKKGSFEMDWFLQIKSTGSGINIFKKSIVKQLWEKPWLIMCTKSETLSCFHSLLPHFAQQKRGPKMQSILVTKLFSEKETLVPVRNGEKQLLFKSYSESSQTDFSQ